jgi:hypothetical protein
VPAGRIHHLLQALSAAGGARRRDGGGVNVLLVSP